MAGSVNKVILIGNVGRDPEVRTAAGGDKIANLSLATSETWTGKDGEKQERTQWHRIVVLSDRLADVVGQYVRKGSRIYVEGSLQNRSYTDRDGNERHLTEVVLSRFRGELVLLDSKQASDNVQTGIAPPAASSMKQVQAVSRGGAILDDEIPFAPCWQ